jgi:hypothetical protein
MTIRTDALVAAMLLLATPCAGEAWPLIEDFETPVEDAQHLIAGWEIPAGVDIAPVLDEKIVNSGERSLCLDFSRIGPQGAEDPDKAVTCGIVSQWKPVRPGQRYWVSFYHRTQSFKGIDMGYTGGRWAAMAFAHASDPEAVTREVFTGLPYGQLARYGLCNFVAVVPEGCDRARMELAATTTERIEGRPKLYFDDLRITPIPDEFVESRGEVVADSLPRSEVSGDAAPLRRRFPEISTPGYYEFVAELAVDPKDASGTGALAEIRIYNFNDMLTMLQRTHAASAEDFNAAGELTVSLPLVVHHSRKDVGVALELRGLGDVAVRAERLSVVRKKRLNAAEVARRQIGLRGPEAPRPATPQAPAGQKRMSVRYVHDDPPAVWPINGDLEIADDSPERRGPLKDFWRNPLHYPDGIARRDTELAKSGKGCLCLDFTNVPEQLQQKRNYALSCALRTDSYRVAPKARYWASLYYRADGCKYVNKFYRSYALPMFSLRQFRDVPHQGGLFRSSTHLVPDFYGMPYGNVDEWTLMNVVVDIPADLNYATFVFAANANDLRLERPRFFVDDVRVSRIPQQYVDAPGQLIESFEGHPEPMKKYSPLLQFKSAKAVAPGYYEMVFTIKVEDLQPPHERNRGGIVKHNRLGIVHVFDNSPEVLLKKRQWRVIYGSDFFGAEETPREYSMPFVVMQPAAPGAIVGDFQGQGTSPVRVTGCRLILKKLLTAKELEERRVLP